MCKIYLTNFVERFINIFGGQDINIGDELFDKKFIVKTNDVEKVRLFFIKPENSWIDLGSNALRAVPGRFVTMHNGASFGPP